MPEITDTTEFVPKSEIPHLLTELKQLRDERVEVGKVEQLFKLITDNVADLLAVVRPDGTRVWNNQAYFSTLGYQPESLEGSYSLSEVHEEDLPKVELAFQESLKTGMGRKVEYRMRHKKGHWVLLESQARIVTNEQGDVECLVLVARDVSSRKKMEEELIKAKKIEAVSSLASGVGHEFKNILENLIEHIKAAQNATGNNEIARGHLERADNSTRQAQQVVARLLSLGMSEDEEMTLSSLEPLLKGVVNSAVSNKATKVDFQIPVGLEQVRVAQSSFCEAIRLVVDNAVDAMRGAGSLTVSVSKVQFSLDSPSRPPQLAPGSYLSVMIEDEGAGVDPGAVDRVFEPYFTTKANRSGLGLTSALSILSRHGGTISLDSKLGQGTKVRLYLPSLKSQMESVPVVHPKATHGPRKILFMDDEELVRKFVGTLLRQLGYEVTLAKDGKEVIDLYAAALEQGWAYDGVVMDLLIPHGVGGAAAVHTLKQMDPGVVAIASSGYIDQPVMQDPHAFGFSAVIAKPYNRERLSEVLKTALKIGV
ncbi:MAG: PAS domain S-box protein [Blastochloris sp.]|nr:PAS domain S-box protein [Blastochloris sp.]